MSGVFFYGATPLNQDEEAQLLWTTTAIAQGNIQQILWRTGLVGKWFWEDTPRFLADQAALYPIFDGCLHLFEYRARWFDDVVKKSPRSCYLSEMISFIQEELSFLSHHRMNENVASVLQVISRDYQKELSNADISRGPSLLIQSIWANWLLNEKPMQLSQNFSTNSGSRPPSSLLSTNDSIEDICYKGRYSSVGYFTRFSANSVANRLKTYRHVSHDRAYRRWVC